MGAPTIKWIQGYLLRHWHTTCHSLFNSPTINQSIIQSGMIYWLAIHLVNKWPLFWLSHSLTHTQRPVVGQWWRNFQTAHEIYYSRLLNCPAKLNTGLKSAIYYLQTYMSGTLKLSWAPNIWSGPLNFKSKGPSWPLAWKCYGPSLGRAA